MTPMGKSNFGWLPWVGGWPSFSRTADFCGWVSEEISIIEGALCFPRHGVACPSNQDGRGVSWVMAVGGTLCTRPSGWGAGARNAHLCFLKEPVAVRAAVGFVDQSLQRFRGMSLVLLRFLWRRLCVQKCSRLLQPSACAGAGVEAAMTDLVEALR